MQIHQSSAHSKWFSCRGWLTCRMQAESALTALPDFHSRQSTERLNGLRAAWKLNRPDVTAHFAALGYEMTGGSAEEFAAFIREDTARYARVIRAIGGAIE